MSQRFEPESGADHKSWAESLFVRAVMEWMPAEARIELNAIEKDNNTDEAVQVWARRWHLDCPCIITWARGDVMVRDIIGPGARVWASKGFKIPRVWLRTLHDLSGTLLDPNGWDLRDLSRGWDIDFMRSASPLAADPLLENRARFLKRARGHWEARADLARDLGFPTVTMKPSLEMHIGWLARYQMAGESLAQLAVDAGRDFDSDAVRKAVKKLQTLLELAPPRKPGRPRKVVEKTGLEP